MTVVDALLRPAAGRARRRIARSDTWRHIADRRYRRWLRLVEPSAEDLSRLELPPGGRPRVSVVVPIYRPQAEHLQEAIESVRAQCYDDWELILVDDASEDAELTELLRRSERCDSRIRVVVRPENGGISRASNDGVAAATGDVVAFLDHDDRLAPWALFFVARALQMHPTAEIIYSDEDKLDDRGRRHSPHFKPSWNPELLRGYNYFCHLLVIRRSLIEQVGFLRPEYDGAQDYDLVLRCISDVEESSIVHIPAILYHWRATPSSTAADIAAKPGALSAGRNALLSAFPSDQVAIDERWFFYRTKAGSPALPINTVTVVVPTRDGGPVLQRCIETLTAAPSAYELQLIVVDNASADPETLDLLAHLGKSGAAEIVRDERPFNYSQLNNVGAERARGEAILFLNDDTEIIRDDWLQTLTAHLQPGVGIVGPRLLYPDGRVQHAGVVVGGVAAAERFKGADPEQPSYMSRLAISAAVSAVTGACLLTRTDSFREIGGFDASEFPIGYSDVDLCLRARRAGWRSVYAADVDVLHHESYSRKLDASTPEASARLDREIGRLWRRWGTELVYDDMYSAYLSHEGADFKRATEPPPYLAWTGDVPDVRMHTRNVPPLLWFGGR